MKLISLSFCSPTRIGTELLHHVSLKPLSHHGVESLEWVEEHQWAVVVFKGEPLIVPQGNIASMTPVPEVEQTDEDLGVDTPSSYCECDRVHGNFHKYCPVCKLLIPGREHYKENSRGIQKEDKQEDDSQAEAEARGVV
jgi:hypothetical protein